MVSHSSPGSCARRSPRAGRCKYLMATGCCLLPDELFCVESGASELGTALGVDHLPGFTPEDIASFKALGAEVCLQSDLFGELWLVPSYTGQPRREIIPEHVATLIQVTKVFPGARVTAFTPPKSCKRGEVA